ncbi:MAG: hypothetical protein R2764_04045 [Bacteroidales bacterium]
MRKIISFLSLAIFMTLSVYAQNKDGAVHLPESLDFDQIIISEANVTGNKLTKNWVIVRELDFKIGDTLSVSHEKKLKESVFAGRFNRVVFTHEIQPG